MKNKYSVTIIPSDHREKPLQFQFSSRLKRRVLAGLTGFGVCLALLVAHDVYQHTYIDAYANKYAYIDQLESELQAKNLEIARLNGTVDDINRDLLSIASMQAEVSTILDLDQAVVPASGEISRGASHQAFRSSETLDQASRQVQTYLTSMQTYYDETLAYDDKLRHTPNLLPVNGPISSPFGYRRNPFGGRNSEFHDGIDLSVAYGTAIQTPADGIVLSARYESGWGYRIDINHGYGVETFYTHLSKMTVQVGQAVARAEVIGYTGNSGRSTGTHLHYGAHIDGQPVDPLFFTLPTQES